MQLKSLSCLGYNVFRKGITCSREFPHARNLVTIKWHLKDLLEGTAELVNTISKSTPINKVWTRDQMSNMLLLNDNVRIRGKRLSEEGNVIIQVNLGMRCAGRFHQFTQSASLRCVLWHPSLCLQSKQTGKLDWSWVAMEMRSITVIFHYGHTTSVLTSLQDSTWLTAPCQRIWVLTEVFFFWQQLALTDSRTKAGWPGLLSVPVRGKGTRASPQSC